MSENTQQDVSDQGEQSGESVSTSRESTGSSGVAGFSKQVILYSIVTGIVLGITSITVGLTSIQPSQVIQSAGQALLLSFLIGGTIVGIITHYLLQQRVTAAREANTELETELDSLFKQLEIPKVNESPEKRVQYLRQCAEDDELKLVSPNHTETNKPTENTVSDAVEELGLGKIPPEETAAYDVVDELQEFDSDEPTPLLEALSELSEEAETTVENTELVQDYEKVRDAFDTYEPKSLTISSNPNDGDFKTALETLNQLKDNIEVSKIEKPPTNIRPHLVKFIEEILNTVSSFETVHHQSSKSEDEVDLQAASAVQNDSSVTIPPNSVASDLINNLQYAQDGQKLQNTLQTVVVQLNAHQNVENAVGDSAVLHRDLEDLQRDVEALQGPVAGIFETHVNQLEELLDRSSNQDLVQRFTVQEDIEMLQNLASSMKDQYTSQAGSVNEHVESLEEDLNTFVREYTNSRGREHYNHGIPNRFLSIAEDLHSLANESVGHSDDRAEAYADAGERVLDGVRDLYQEPEYSMVIDPTT